jgi:aminopeptidase YwaD
MHAFKKTLAASLSLGLAACSAGSAEPDTEGLTTDPDGFAAGEAYGNGSDPMAHISYLASDLMKGRNSPSADLSNAASYIKVYLTKHGLTGPNPADTNGPYAQTFTIGSFKGADALAHHETDGPHLEFGVKLFEDAFYIDSRMSLTAQDTASLRYEESMTAQGVAVGPHQLRPISELQAAATFAGPVQNVLGKLDGTGTKANEVVLVMAHLDHIGTTTGGTVFNGADDNASGSSVILSIIPGLVAAKQAGQLNRSVLFMWTAGEEKGLVGAQYFVDHPISGIGLSNISGVINMDMVARWDDQRLSVIDTTTSGSANYFRALLESANTAMSDPFDKLNRDIQTYIDRQDGWAFMNAGEDVLFLFEGLSNPNGGGSLNADYHASGDDIDKIISENDGNKPRRVRDLLIDVVKRASNK